MRAGWLLVFPALLGVVATSTDYLPAKMGVPLACAVILLWTLRHVLARRRDVFFVVAALVFSAIGDYFLSNKGGSESYFIIGIGLYFVAHLGYLGFAWRNGRLHRLALGILLLGFVPYYLILLNPSISDPVLSGAVLLYLLISCLVLAVAFGLRLPPTPKWLYVAGIALIVFSDTAISFNEFLDYRGLNWLILPTYYLAHLCVSYALLRRETQKTAVAAPA